MSIRIQCLTVDSADPRRLAEFWSQALGWRITYDEGDEVVIEPPEGSAECDVCPDLLFIKVDDPKTVKNRLHLDLRPDDQQAEIERITQLGARPVDIGQDGTESWSVLADPEGNEFCILRPLTEEELAS
jgi:predicted enzyme related to lactoylglutathione lyase